MSNTEKTVTEATGAVSCCFSWPGTYGHECGKPAVEFAVKKSDLTKSGLFYAGRCAECKGHNSLENFNVVRFEKLNGQKNEWK